MSLLCPSCKVDLVMSDRQGIEIDYCPKCRGVWLDRGELDKIIERSGSQPAAQTQAMPGAGPGMDAGMGGAGGLASIARKMLRDDDDDYYKRQSHYQGYDHRGTPYGYKKKKNWLKEIFD
jgi:uncharacterized protein